MGHRVDLAFIRRACQSCGARKSIEKLTYATYIDRIGGRHGGRVVCPDCLAQLPKILLGNDETIVLTCHPA